MKTINFIGTTREEAEEKLKLWKVDKSSVEICSRVMISHPAEAKSDANDKEEDAFVSIQISYRESN